MGIIQMNYLVLEGPSLLPIKNKLVWLIVVFGWNSMDILEVLLIRHLKIIYNSG